MDEYEYNIQKTFHDWCGKQPYILEHWHVPNGMKASSKACTMMKKIGLHKGVCDYWVLLDNNKLLVIEFKNSNGVLSTEQKVFIQHLKQANIPVMVCRTPFEATTFVKQQRLDCRLGNTPSRQ